MCKGCAEAVERHFPDCPPKDYGAFLINATAFPFGGAEVVDRQLAEAKAAGCLTWKAAIAWANQQTWDEMEMIGAEQAKRREREPRHAAGSGTRARRGADNNAAPPLPPQGTV